MLEIGCATGYMSEVLRDRLGCTVVGVELSPEAAALAEGRAARVITADAETVDWEAALGDERFDAVVFADVLEHLRDPRAVLQRVSPFLSSTGAVVASVPNVAHASVRLALLAGEFRYRPTGLLDETHLRFFTRASLQDLFESAGHVVTTWLRARRSIEESEVAVPGVAEGGAARAIAAADPEATTYQFVVRAVPAESAVVAAQLRDEARRSAESLDAALRELSAVRRSLFSAERDLRERDALIDRLNMHIESLSRAHDERVADLGAAHAALDRNSLVRVRRELARRVPPVRALSLKLRGRFR